MILAALPSSTNYSLNSYGFGSGGSANSSSTNYGLNATAGEQAGNTSSTNYKLGAGEKYLKQANVPTISLVNNARWYNKLLVTIGPENNPSDATFAIAISSDNFATTQYVKADHTVGSTLTTGDYATYAGWGGAAGVYIVSLSDTTTYIAKAKAYRGAFTESGYGPTATANTSPPLLTFDIDVAATDISTSPPYLVDLGELLANSVIDSTNRVWTTLDTNAESGGIVYVSGQNSGLRSTTANYTIASSSGDLAAQQEGFGAQIASAGQSSGGPLTGAASYSVTGSNIGATDSQIRNLFTSAAPIISGRGSFILKAKSKDQTPSSTDYSEILTVIASANF
ncbi:MAG: hypothetical protein ABIS59_03350 [Candidatus Saccharibacteria bacterium]